MTENERTDEDMQEEPTQETTAEEAQPGEPIEEPQAEEAVSEAAPPETDVFDMLRAAIGLFTQEAWVALGLQPRYGSGATQLDLRCAKVAIDSTRMLIEQLGDEAGAEEKREFDRILTDLRVNFMRRRKRTEEEA